MISAYGLLGSFGSRVGSKYIVHNTYRGRRSTFRSKPTQIHGLFYKSDLNYSYSISHFSMLSQAVAKTLFYRLSHKVSNYSKIIDPFFNGFISND